MDKKDKWFEIVDLDKFIESSRVLVFDNFGKTEDSQMVIFDIEQLKKSEKEELNTILTQEECMVIAKDFLKLKRHKKTKQTIHVITTSNYFKMMESFNDRLVSNLLNSLVNKGYLESAFDPEYNDFVFWIKEEKK